MPDPETHNTGGEQEAAPTVLFVCTDLMFGVQLQNMARHTGVRHITARPGSPLPAADLVVVDLAARLDVGAAIKEAAARGMRVVAFGPHMDARGRRIAKEAGAQRVLTNSNLARELPLIMQSLKAGSS